MTLRPHQIKGSNIIVDFAKNKTFGNYFSVACCVSSGKTLLAIDGMLNAIQFSSKTFQVFVCPRLKLCKQQAEEIINEVSKRKIPGTQVLLYNSDTTTDLEVISDRKVIADEEFFTGASHIIVVACDESLWGGGLDSIFRQAKFKNILKNNISYGRENLTIVYDEAHNYQSKKDVIDDFKNYFYTTVLMSGTPAEYQRDIHKNWPSVSYSIKDALNDNIICKPTLNVIRGYGDDDSYLLSAVESALVNENHTAPFSTRLLVCARGINPIHSVCDNLKNCHVIVLHSDKTVDDENVIKSLTSKIDGVEKNVNETMDVIESLDTGNNYFNDTLPIVVFQVDMISEGINIKSFNSVLITSYSEIKQMQQIGRILREWKIAGKSKKTDDNVNIYATCENDDDLADLLINLEQHELTHDVFKWGKLTDVYNGSAPDADGIARFSKWQQIQEVLDIEKIYSMRNQIHNNRINNRLSTIVSKLPPNIFNVLSRITGNTNSNKTQKSAINNNNKNADNKTQKNVTAVKKHSEKKKENLVRLFFNKLDTTLQLGNIASRKVWSKNKSKVIQGIIPCNDEEAKEIVDLVDGMWRF